MKSYFYQKLIYKLVSQVIIFPIYKLIFRGKLIGRENIPQKGAFIMVSNHGSLLDPPLLGHAIGRNISFMAKSELFRIPLLGFIIKSCGAYPVKRGIVDKTTIKIACEKLSNNNSIGIFIDGTRQKDGRVNKPKQGAALLSFKNQMCNGVKWRQTMDLMKENSILQMVEIGPSNVLGGLGKRHLKDVKISQVSSADQIKY